MVEKEYYNEVRKIKSALEMEQKKELLIHAHLQRYEANRNPFNLYNKYLCVLLEKSCCHQLRHKSALLHGNMQYKTSHLCTQYIHI